MYNRYVLITLYVLISYCGVFGDEPNGAWNEYSTMFLDSL